MKTLVILPILFLSTACATPETKRDVAGFSFKSDNRLEHYVKDFMKYCKTVLGEDKCNPKIDLDVSIANLNDGTLGQCTIYDKPSRRRNIEIDIGTIGQYNERAVLYHELFHCILEKPHYDGEIDIMNTYEIEENTYYIYSYWDYFVKKAFERD